jgi:hypothetical protein
MDPSINRSLEQEILLQLPAPKDTTLIYLQSRLEFNS